MKIEVNSNPCKTQKEAEKGPWQEVEKGFEYGPAYTTFWFRLSGKVPKEWEGKEVVVHAEIGSERTLWKDNSPFRGVDYEHTDFGFLTGGTLPTEGPVKGGENVSYVIEAYTKNPQCRVHLKELPREPKVEKVEFADLVIVNNDVKALYFDVDFAYDLLSSVDKEDPSFYTLLQALNEVINLFAKDGLDSITRSRKIIKDALGSLNSEYKHTIYPVGHAHLDTAWLWPISITKQKMAHTTATQLSLMEKYPQYIFVHSQASQYEWLEKDYPKLFERVKAAIDRGQWEPVGSMWVEADCNLTGAESLVRQFLYGKRYFKEKLGYTTHDMWLPDVFGYSAALPQILEKFNISYFLTQKISWNQFNKFPHHTFYWQGIDGTKVWTHFPPADTYNASCEPKEVIKSVKNYKDHARSENSLYVFGHGDGGGGPTERHLEFIQRGRMAPNYPEVMFGKRAIDFFRDAKAKSKDLMTWVGELYLELHRGTYTSQAANKKSNRDCEFLLRDADWLAFFAGGKHPSKKLEEAWKLVLLNQFHDIIPGSSVHEVYVDSKVDYEAVEKMGNEVIQDSLKAISKKLDSSEFSKPIAMFQNGNVPTQASIPWTDEETPVGLKVGDEFLPVQLVEEFGERKLIFETPQDALSTVAVGDFKESGTPLKNRLKGSSRKLENDQFSVRFDVNGNISSIQSLEDGTEFVEPGKLANVFQLMEDKPLFWSAWDVDVYAYETAQDLLKSESVELVEKGPVRVAIEIVKKFGQSTIRQRISLGPTPGIRFDTEIDWHEEDKMLKVAFPVKVNSSRATYEIQFGNVERPTHYNTSWDMARFEVCAQKWVDLSEGDLGVALINDGKYGHDINGNVMRMSLLRAPKAPDPECDMGVHRFSYVLLPHFGPYNYADVVHAAYAHNSPLRAAMIEPTAGPATQLDPLVTCDDRNIVIETVKKAEDSDDLIIRLYECHNSRGQAELFCVNAPGEAVLCDLEENEIADLDVNDGLVQFSYKPFEIITIKLKG
ncbi:MAG: alpha-mannosidase [Armatimonadetes bacterium]|nr:alpha-mannosidase [Armatimonadota bacterium]